MGIFAEQVRKRSVVFCWGRFQPITKGHSIVFNKASHIADRSSCPFMIFTPQTYDKVKNPLPYDRKIEYIRKAFPEYRVVYNENIRTVMDVVKFLEEKGFNSFMMVVGSDRYDDFSQAFDHRDDMTVISAGNDREETNYDGSVETVSGSLAREVAQEGNIDKFATIVPASLDRISIRKLYRDVRRGLKI